jgi:EmrB/QacA subfamily drug resistance transporter
MASQPKSKLLLPVLFTGTFMVLLDIFVTNVAAPSIRTELGASEGDVQWVVAGYLVAYAVSLITGGRLGDVFGRRRMFRIGLVVFTAASALCAAAPSPSALIAARVIQGLGGAMVWPQVLSVIQVEYDLLERPGKLAIMGFVGGMASITGQIVGGGLIALDAFGLGWRWVFLINVPVGIAAYLLAGRAIPESRSPSARRLDLPGVALGSALLLLIMIPIVEGRELGWPTWVFVAAALAVPLGIAFVRLERRIEARGGAPLVELPLFAERGFRLGSLAMLIVYGVITFFLLIAIYLQEGIGLSAIDSGLLFTPLAVAFAAASLRGPRLLGPRLGDRLPALGALLAAVGIAATITVVSASAGELAALPLVLAFLPVGAGMGLFIPSTINVVLRSVPTEDAGAASGMLTTIQQVGNALGVAIVGSVFFAVLGDRTGGAAFAEAFSVAAAIQVGLALCGAVLVARAARRVEPASAPTPATAVGSASH